jgi:hypothetical protein
MNYSRLFVSVALVIVVGLLVTPFVLSNRYTSQLDYKDEMAEWHVSWSDSSDTRERAALLPALEEIRPPVGSVELLDQYRIYKQAHVILSQADEMLTTALQELATSIPNGDSDQALTCENLSLMSADDRTGANELAGAAWAEETCTLRAMANKQLVILRAQASMGWLRDEIQEYRKSLISGN